MGSLSIPMMCIQTPGSFVWVGSLAARFGWEGWSTWGIYLVTGILQGCLLVMAITFEIRKRLEKKHGQEASDNSRDAHVGAVDGYQDRDGDHEQTALIANER